MEEPGTFNDLLEDCEARNYIPEEELYVKASNCDWGGEGATRL